METGDTSNFYFFFVFNLFHCSTKRTEAFNHQLVWVLTDLVWDSVYAANPAAPTLFLVVTPQHRPTSYLAVNLLTVIPDAGRRFKKFFDHVLFATRSWRHRTFGGRQSDIRRIIGGPSIHLWGPPGFEWTWVAIY